jgi:hypothetical protein
VEEVVILVADDFFLTRDDSADGALFAFGHPSFRWEGDNVSGRWGFWTMGVFGHDDKGWFCLPNTAPEVFYFCVVVSKWLWCLLVWCILDMDRFGGKQKEDSLDFFQEIMFEKGEAGRGGDAGEWVFGAKAFLDLFYRT